MNGTCFSFLKKDREEKGREREVEKEFRERSQMTFGESRNGFLDDEGFYDWFYDFKINSTFSQKI